MDLDDVPDWFFRQVLKGNRNATDDDIIKAYLEQQATSSSRFPVTASTVLDKAFKVPFQQDVNYLAKLDQQIHAVANGGNEFYNYLAIVQSSGYGKTRAALELAKTHPLIYICLRKEGSTGYPPATPQRKNWQENLLNNLQTQHEFWNSVSQNRDNNKCLRSVNEKIILYFDEASALLGTGSQEKNQAFRAIRRALWECKHVAIGIFTDTNSSVANLVPSKEHDPSTRDTNRDLHKPFIYINIATMDCLHNSIPHLEKINPAYDIVRFGRPLWGSQWSGQTAETDQGRFDEILHLAKSKLTGGVLKWSEIQEDTIRQRVALALLACTAALYVSPTSSVAPELVKSHMATLVAVDDECERHLITYPSEPLLPEASMELLSEKGVEIVVLKELEAVYKSGGILNAGDQGELAVKLLLLGAWRCLICSERHTNKRVLFSARQPVMAFLHELLNPDGLSR
ncbi:5338_t:CDS:2, partial [Paraglomus brasilianum]